MTTTAKDPKVTSGKGKKHIEEPVKDPAQIAAEEAVLKNYPHCQERIIHRSANCIIVAQNKLKEHEVS